MKNKPKDSVSQDLALEDVMRLISEAIAPDMMGKKEALEWLGNLQSDIESQMDCLRDEIKNEEK